MALTFLVLLQRLVGVVVFQPLYFVHFYDFCQYVGCGSVALHDISLPTPFAAYFIIGPLLLTGLAATGLHWMEYTLDVEYLTTPINGRAKTERAVQDRHFPQNFSDFDTLRISSNGKYAQLIIEVMQNKGFFAKP